jgi:hypothetical protein
MSTSTGLVSETLRSNVTLRFAYRLRNGVHDSLLFPHDDVWRYTLSKDLISHIVCLLGDLLPLVWHVWLYHWFGCTSGVLIMMAALSGWLC